MGTNIPGKLVTIMMNQATNSDISKENETMVFNIETVHT